MQGTIRCVRQLFKVPLVSSRPALYLTTNSSHFKTCYCSYYSRHLTNRTALDLGFRHRKSITMSSVTGDSSHSSSAASGGDPSVVKPDTDADAMEEETALAKGFSSVDMDLSDSHSNGGGVSEETVEMIKEGKVQIPKGVNIFYNPTQEFNRDISVLAIQTFLKSENKNDATILEAMSASGIRAIRYAKEITGIKSVIANDFSMSAVETIKGNSKLNQVEGIVTPSFADASDKMYECRNSATVVDIDPYGTPTKFLDSAIQCIEEEGLLLVTATDMAVLAGGNHADSCFAKYGSMSLKSKACHEIALRIVAHTVQNTANRYGRVAIPLLSLSVDFYIRLIFKVIKGAKKAKQSVLNTSMIFQCTGCKSITLQPLAAIRKGHTSFAQGPSVSKKCEHCDSSHHFAGPIWSGRIHNREFLDKMNQELLENFTYLKTFDRIRGMIGLAEEELEDQPLYYDISELCSLVKSSSMPMMQMRSAIMNMGYEVSLTHAEPNKIKTNIPNQKLWDIFRAWRRQTNPKPMPEDTVGYKIMSRESSVKEIDFTIRPDAKPQSQNMNLLRYQTNPEKFWGPGSKDNFKSQGDGGPSKRELNQGKKTKPKRRKTNNVKSN